GAHGGHGVDHRRLAGARVAREQETLARDGHHVVPGERAPVHQLDARQAPLSGVRRRHQLSFASRAYSVLRAATWSAPNTVRSTGETAARSPPSGSRTPDSTSRAHVASSCRVKSMGEPPTRRRYTPRWSAASSRLI